MTEHRPAFAPPRLGAAVATAAVLAAFAAAWAAVVIAAPTDATSVKDEPWHANTLLRLLAEPTLDPDDVLLAHIDYPPLFYASAFTLGKLTGRGDRAGLAAANLCFFLLTVALAAAMAARDRPASRGPLAALLAGLILFPRSYTVTVDTSLVVACATFFYALTRGGADWRAWPLIGAAAGLALLAKQTAPLYLAGLFVAFVVVVGLPRLGLKRTLALTTVIALCAGVVAWLGFYREPSVVQALGARVERGSLATTAGYGLFRHLAYYPGLLAAPFLGAIALRLPPLARRRADEIDWMALAGTVVAVAALTWYRSKFWEYLLPAYFPLAVMLARGVSLEAPRRPLKWTILIANLGLLVVAAADDPLRLIQWQREEAKAVAQLTDRLERWTPRLPGELRVFDPGTFMWRMRVENELVRRGDRLRLPSLGHPDSPGLRPDVAAVLVLRRDRTDGWRDNCGTTTEVAAAAAIRNWYAPRCDERCERLVAGLNERFEPVMSEPLPGSGGWTLCTRRASSD